MNVTLVDYTARAEEKIATFSAICYGADTAPDANARRIKRLMKSRHLSTMRFASATFLVEGISRICSHQLVRHPHLSYLQSSQRFRSQKNESFVVPNSIQQDKSMLANWGHILACSQDIYDEAIRKGVRKEDARFILPQSCTTEMYVTGNFQAWLDFIARRTDEHAQWEVREVALEIQRLLRGVAPNVFG